VRACCSKRMSNPLIPKRDYTELSIKRTNFHR
jgi:hypothetical protein